MTSQGTTKGSAVLTMPSDTEILITRAFAAPPTQVWRVFTEPELIKRWWAGRRGIMTAAEIDLSEGGRWRCAMDAGGVEIAFRGTYRQIVAGERIVCTEIYQSGPGAADEEPGVLCTYTFTPTHDGTTLTLLTQASDRATRDAIVTSGMEDGMQQGYDLAEEIAVELANEPSR